MKPFRLQSHYELLEVSVVASLGEIRGAYERLARLYADDQVALYGLIEPTRAEALRLRLQEALAVLTDDARREQYDVSIGLPPRLPPVGRPTEEVPAAAGPTPRRSAGWGAVSYEWVTAPPPPPQVFVSESVTFVLEATPAMVPAPASVEAPGRALAAPPLQLDQVVEPERSPPRVILAELSAAKAAPPFAGQAEVPLESNAPIRPVNDLALRWDASPEEPDGEAGRARAAPLARVHRPSSPRTRPHEVPAGVEFNGDLLRQVRMARGMSLVQLSERTRIHPRHLENVEHDRYEALPAEVYLRGILMNLARELGLDGIQVAQSYLSFVEARGPKD